MRGMGRWVKDKTAYAVAGAVGALTVFVLDHYEHIVADVQEYITGPVIGVVLGGIRDWIKGNKIVEKPADKVEDYIEPERREKAADDKITENEQLQKQAEIQAKLERLLGAVDGADRVIIHKFHNGGKFYTEQSTQKMAVVYQASRYKYYKIDNELNGGNFNLEKMGGILKKVVDKRYLHLTMKEDKEKYKHTIYFQILEEDGVEANHLRIIRSGRETYRNIGLLSIHFIKRKKKGLSEREIRLIDESVRDIQLLLVQDLKGYPKHQI
jgi:hypothetical protein